MRNVVSSTRRSSKIVPSLSREKWVVSDAKPDEIHEPLIIPLLSRFRRVAVAKAVVMHYDRDARVRGSGFTLRVVATAFHVPSSRFRVPG